MCKHDGRKAAKNAAFHDMLQDDITLCLYDMLYGDLMIHVVLKDEKVIGRNIDKQINVLIDIYTM